MLFRDIMTIIFWRTLETVSELFTLLLMVWALPGTLMWLFNTSFSLSNSFESLGSTVFGYSAAADLFRMVLHEGSFAFGYLVGTFGIIVASIVLRIIAGLFGR